MKKPFNHQSPLLHQLEERGLEFDQKLRCALEISASNPELDFEGKGYPDSYLLLALYRMNTALTRHVRLDESRYTNIFHEYRRAPRCAPADVIPSRRCCNLLDAMARYPAEDNTLGVGHFLRALADVSLHESALDVGFYPATGRNVLHPTFAIETLLWGMGHHAWKPHEEATEVCDLLRSFEKLEPVEDIQYVLDLREDRIVFRPTSCLGDFSFSTEAGLVVPTRAILTHFRDQYGGFTEDEIQELEELINNPRARESELQQFFERYPHFFRKWDCRDVFPQVYLDRSDSGPLVPDFILTNPELQKAVILDLKKPFARIVRRQKNRERFSAAVLEAKAQLLEYREWFADPGNRKRLTKSIGMEIYQPYLAVVIGRSSEFRPGIERQKLAASEPQLEVATFDDIAAYADQRRLIIKR